MLAEPWFTIPVPRYFENWGRRDEIAYNQANRAAEKQRFFCNAFDFLTDNRVSGEYWEFGCHRARTFRMAMIEARRHNLDLMKFVAFDSFEGLPEPLTSQVVEIWKKGALATSEAEFMHLVGGLGFYAQNVELVPGFYSESLKDSARFHGRRAALVTVDCDLYESSADVFAFIDPFLQAGSVVYLDDFFAGYKGDPAQGMQRAFNEYRARSAWHFAEHMSIGWWGKSFIVNERGEVPMT